MKILLKIVLWVSWLSAMYAGTQLLGFGIFAPVMITPGMGMGISMQVFAQQILAVCGGRGRILAAGAACVLLAILCRKLLRHLRQTESDQLAEQILNRVREGKDPLQPFFLYLRAFETTRRLKAPLFLMDMATMGLNRLWTGELESFVNGALIKAGPLIALGHPGEIFGAGRVTTSDDAWMSDIALLAAKARGILLIPSHRPGTLWEIEHLEREGLLAKTILVMPPESRRFNWSSHWSQARRAMGVLGGALPEYDELGLLFTLDQTRGVCGVEPFSLFFGWSLRKSVLKLLERRDQNADVDRALRRARRRARQWRFIGRFNLLLRGAAYAILALVLVFGVRAGPPPYEKLSWRAFGDRFMNAAEIEERQTSIESEFGDSAAYQQVADPLSYEQQAALRAEMTHAGFRRLNDTQLRTAYAAMSQLLARSDAQTCASIARRALPDDQMNQALLKVDPLLLTDWLDMSREAAIAELHQQPLAAVSYLGLIEANHRFEASLDGKELSRLRMLSTADASRPVDDECWLARKSYSAVQTLPAPYNLAWARLLEMKEERPVVQELVSHPLEKLKEFPLFQARTRGLSEKQVNDLFSDLAGKGVERLDDGSLLARYSAVSELLSKLDEPACENFALGGATTEQWEAALGRISDSGQAGFLDSQYRAAQAELEQIKPVILSKEELQIANEQFASTFRGDEVERLNRLGAGSGQSSRETECWIVRKDFAAVTTLKEPYNRMWAHALAQTK